MNAARTVRIGGELVTVPRRSADQPRRLVWPRAEPIYRSLCKKTGSSFATDRAILAMIYLDTGYVFGDRSIARARRREAKRGTIVSRRIKPNRIAGTVRTFAGTVRVSFPSEQEKRESRWREKIEARKRRRERREEASLARKRAADLVRHDPQGLPPAEPLVIQEPPESRVAASVHLRTALAAIKGIQLAPLLRQEQPSEIAVKPAADEHRRTIAEQLAELERLGLEVPKKPPDS